jgi:hypothetical protein
MCNIYHTNYKYVDLEILVGEKNILDINYVSYIRLFNQKGTLFDLVGTKNKKLESDRRSFLFLASNDTTVKSALKGAINQLGEYLSRIIHEAKIFLAKWDIKDGFWRMDCTSGPEKKMILMGHKISSFHAPLPLVRSSYTNFNVIRWVLANGLYSQNQKKR